MLCGGFRFPQVGRGDVMRWRKGDIQKLERMYKQQVPYVRIARDMGRSVDAVKSAASRFGIAQKRRGQKKQKTRYNPNPITYNTRVIVCCSTFRGESIKQIAQDLERPEELIADILYQCIKNGFYWRINADQEQYVTGKKGREVYNAVVKAYERVAPFI